MNQISKTRRATTVKLAGLELPACFAEATLSAAARAADNTRQADRRDFRRLADKTTRLIERGAL